MTKKLKLKISSRLLKKRSRRFGSNQRKTCRFCASVENFNGLDYKNASLLKNFITERGKILPSRISGNCAFHQRMLAGEIKQARIMALVPYCAAAY